MQDAKNNHPWSQLPSAPGIHTFTPTTCKLDPPLCPVSANDSPFSSSSRRSISRGVLRDSLLITTWGGGSRQDRTVSRSKSQHSSTLTVAQHGPCRATAALHSRTQVIPTSPLPHFTPSHPAPHRRTSHPRAHPTIITHRDLPASVHGAVELGQRLISIAVVAILNKAKALGAPGDEQEGAGVAGGAKGSAGEQLGAHGQGRQWMQSFA